MVDPNGGASDLYNRQQLVYRGQRKRKRKTGAAAAGAAGATAAAGADASWPAGVRSKVRRIDLGSQLGAQLSGLGGAAAEEDGLEEEGLEEEGYDEEEEEMAMARVLPLDVSTVVAAESEGGPWSVVTKGFFHANRSVLRAGYWVHHRGHCVAAAIIWTTEFGELRYEQQGFGSFAAAAAAAAAVDASTSSSSGGSSSAAASCSSSSSLALHKANVSAVSVGLMAILDAIAYISSSCSCGAPWLSAQQWRVSSDNSDALKLVDMYQRNLQFLKFHAERPLLDLIMQAARSLPTGRLLLRRRH